MRTRCPNCDTRFRVTPEQLKIRQGQVRCGQCRKVFDALESLEEEITPPPAATPEPEPSAAVPAAGMPEPATQAGEHAVPALPGEAPAIGFVDVAADKPLAEPVVSPDDLGPATVPQEFLAATTPEPEPEPALHDEEESPPPRWPWVIGSLLAAGVLAVQGLLHFRTELAVLAPEIRPALTMLGDAFGLDIGQPRRIELIGIETSDLSPDKDQPGRLQLTATLRNRAPFAQAWPHLELTLTDARDRPVLRRALAPAEYLPPAPAKGFPARGEQAVQLVIELTDTTAAGYRLYLFYP